MNKDVLITVNGLRLPDSDEEDIQVVTSGKYYNKGGKDYILYEEYLGDLEEFIKCNIIVDNNKVEIVKHGAANVHMIFDKLKRNTSYYQTPYGNLLMGFDTTDIRIEKAEKEINIFLKYNIDINYNHVSENDIYINIKSKDT